MNIMFQYGFNRFVVTAMGIGLFVASAFVAPSAFAVVTVTSATGGTGISADTVGGAYTSLGPIIINESANADIAGNLSNATIILKAPTGFEFNTAKTPSIDFVAAKDVTALSIAMTDTSTITITLSTNAANRKDTITIGATTAVQVRPSAGTPLASGQIYRPTTGGGTAGSIAGVTTTDIASGAGGTNFGTLAEVIGAFSVLTISPANSTITADQTATFTATGADQFGNSYGDKTGTTVFSMSGGAGGSFAVNTYTANTAGTWTVTGIDGSVTGTTNLTVTPGAATQAAIVADQTTREAGIQTATLTVTVKDAKNNLVSDGTAINLTTTVGVVSGTGTTVNGVVTRTLTSGTVGTATLAVTSLITSGDTSIVFSDTTPPVIAAQADITAEATSAAGAVVTYTPPSTTDAVDGTGTATCLPASGTTFTLGTTTVTCNAIDAATNNATATTFNVIVSDTTPPVIAAQADITAEATATTGAVVTFISSSTSDAVDGVQVASCSPASGGMFPVGTTTINCNKTDAAGNSATQVSFNIIITDTTAPVIFLVGSPAVTITANTSYIDAGATASDIADGVITSSIVTVNSVIPNTLGVYTVTYNVSDTAGNAATQVVRTVTVVAAPAPVSGGGGGGGGGSFSSAPSSSVGSLGANSGTTTPVSVPNPTPSPVPSVTPTPRVLGAAKVNVPQVEKLLVKKTDSRLAARLAGRFLIQVESSGYLWYVDPVSRNKYYIDSSKSIIAVLRTFALKANTATLKGIPVSDPTGKTKPKSNTLLKGRILLGSDNVLWYVNPVDGTRTDISTDARVLALIKGKALGINNATIRTIAVGIK